MPSIFDDINIDESPDTDLYDALNSMDIKELEEEPEYPGERAFNFNINEATKGFILSYGDSKELIPVGVFVLIGFVDHSNKPVDEAYAKQYGGVAIFKEIELKENGLLDIKEDGGRIIMPYIGFELASLNIDYNNKALDSISSEQFATLKGVNKTVDNIKEVLADEDIKPGFRDIHLKGLPMASSHTSYTLADGTEMGTNYTFYPFMLPPKKIMIAYEPKLEEGSTRKI